MSLDIPWNTLVLVLGPCVRIPEIVGAKAVEAKPCGSEFFNRCTDEMHKIGPVVVIKLSMGE